MQGKRGGRRMVLSLAAVLCSGSVFQGNCATTAQIATAALTAVSEQLSQSQQDDDISFADWLASELEH